MPSRDSTIGTTRRFGCTIMSARISSTKEWMKLPRPGMLRRSPPSTFKSKSTSGRDTRHTSRAPKHGSSAISGASVMRARAATIRSAMPTSAANR